MCASRRTARKQETDREREINAISFCHLKRGYDNKANNSKIINVESVLQRVNKQIHQDIIELAMNDITLKKHFNWFQRWLEYFSLSTYEKYM